MRATYNAATVFALLCGIAVVWCCAIIGATAAAEKAAGTVAVFDGRTSGCANVTARRSLRGVKVAAFGREVRLAEIERTIAKRAETLGFNQIADVRIVASKPRSGVRASALALRCADNDPAGGPAAGAGGGDLEDVVRHAARVNIYDVDPASALTSEPTAASLSKKLRRSMTADEASAAIGLVLEPSTYAPKSPLAAACPFAPRFIIEFVAGDRSAWWVTTCRGEKSTAEVALVGADDNLRRVPSRNLSKAGQSALDHLVTN